MKGWPQPACSRLERHRQMAELVYDAKQLADGQAFILLQVGRGGASNQIVADITRI